MKRKIEDIAYRKVLSDIALEEKTGRQSYLDHFARSSAAGVMSQFDFTAKQDAFVWAALELYARDTSKLFRAYQLACTACAKVERTNIADLDLADFWDK